ncbi:hypothetical protein BDY24DRAFT_344326, partial [Mrakia frigida]|uniref:uncharacterized protein n=1 Tax=Mrakia frigida TaxID=29902 RepID=UPI003FCC007F
MDWEKEVGDGDSEGTRRQGKATKGLIWVGKVGKNSIGLCRIKTRSVFALTPSLPPYRSLKPSVFFPQFAMHNNGARNHALSLSFLLPSTRYALPLDSNCAFTHAGIAAFLDTVARSEAIEQRKHLHREPGEEGKKWEEETKDFVIVPMSRLVRNEDFARWNEELGFEEGMAEEERRERWEGLRPSAPAEPQIAFRFTSTTRFDPSFRYGRRPKLSLLWALGWVPFSRSLHLKTHPWELPDRTITAESFSSLKHMTVEGGWTMRLFSGNEELEREDEVGMAERAGRRVEGVVRFLEGLE